MSVYFTVYGLQFIIPEDECEEFCPSTQAQRWRPLQAVVAKIQVLQFTQGLTRTSDIERSRTNGHKQENTEKKLLIKFDNN